MSSPEPPPALQAYFEAISAMDFGKAAACFADPCHHEDPVGGSVNRAPAGVRQFFEGLGSLFASVRLFPREVHGQGSEWAIAFRGEGKGRNGAEVVFEGIDVFRMDGSGRIVELRAYWNPAATVAKLMA
ncbi:MAG: nuclear transport factor 2 family protein [Acidobacteriota bacterium]|nr:nuclear transport factor 2 family protein [Acidobacteriota bacterium]